MVRSLNSRTIVRLALVGVAAASLGACAKKAQPAFPTTTPPPQTQAPQTQMPPSAPGPVASTQTGALPGSAQDFVVNVGDRVYFDTDSHDVRDDARPILDAQSAWLRRYPGVNVRIEGNADERGTREYNLALGARRAAAARDFLAAQGVSANRIETVSYGKEQPLDPASTEEAWAQNRNAHTVLKGR